MINLNEVLFLTHKSDSVIGKPFINKGFCVESIYKNDHFSYRKFIFLKIFNKENHLFAFNENLIRKYDKIIISECALISCVAKNIYIYNEQCDLKAYFWNTIKDEYIEEVRKLQSLGVETYSFYLGDCIKYNMRYNFQPYPYLENLTIKSYKIKYDCYFCAADKGRIHNIIKLKYFLKCQGVTFSFKILKEKHKKYDYKSNDMDGIELIDIPIDYSTVFKETCQANCIIELLIEGQKGCTLRTMESLNLDKKLITNNKNIKNYDFYNPNNIFILDNNYDKIKYFLELPYEPVPNYIKERYSLKSWIENFFGKKG